MHRRGAGPNANLISETDFPKRSKPGGDLGSMSRTYERMNIRHPTLLRRTLAFLLWTLCLSAVNADRIPHKAAVLSREGERSSQEGAEKLIPEERS
jgi:hypothetical protein